MKYDTVIIDNFHIRVYSLNTAIVGSGAAGLNAADRLYGLGQKDIALITEGLIMGTSRNAGSDKQTYYKLTLSGDAEDSVRHMAQTLFEGGSMHGDIALVEAALSARCFNRLLDIGVPFPHNLYGEYAGYKTDHDPRQRATSAGPLTSRHMTERLQEKVLEKGIKVYDGYQVIKILTHRGSEESLGLLTLNLKALDNPMERYVVFNCTNIIYGTGGPAGIYNSSVYPVSQSGSTGIALEAGVLGRNLTESQYGIASTKFRWNLSGTYQQVLPRYISTDEEGGDEREFLFDYFDSVGRALDAIFLKGYQWPFDPRKIAGGGSSLIDLLVYNEIMVKGRRVFLDYTKNSTMALKDGKFDFSLLGGEAYDYLDKSDVLFGSPIERLKKMNEPAIRLYKDNGIDLFREYLEIGVCAQHNNGGLAGNLWWESNIKHFFPIGEANGSHGVYRPGGSALNSGQVGGLRAAEFIAENYRKDPMDVEDFLGLCKKEIIKGLDLSEGFIDRLHKESNVFDIRKKIGKRTDRNGAFIRSLDKAKSGAREALKDLKALVEKTKISSLADLPQALKNYDLLITQYVYLSAIADYIERGGKSRGSYLIFDKDGDLPSYDLPKEFRFSLDGEALNSQIQEVSYRDNKLEFIWQRVRPLPQGEDWFEKVWEDYRKKNHFK